MNTASKSQGSMNCKDTNEQIETSYIVISTTNINLSNAVNGSPLLVGTYDSCNGFRKN